MAEVAPKLTEEELLVRLALAREETEKFAAEQRKLAAEAQKFGAEQLKLAAEAAKLDVERLVYPFAIGGGFVGALFGSAATATLLSHWLR